VSAEGAERDLKLRISDCRLQIAELGEDRNRRERRGKGRKGSWISGGEREARKERTWNFGLQIAELGGEKPQRSQRARRRVHGACYLMPKVRSSFLSHLWSFLTIASEVSDLVMRTGGP